MGGRREERRGREREEGGGTYIIMHVSDETRMLT